MIKLTQLHGYYFKQNFENVLITARHGYFSFEKLFNTDSI